MGKKFFIRTSYANVVTTLGLIYLKPFPAITTSELLIVLYGGVLFGIGVGIVVKMGGAIDGSEMLAVWMNKHFNVPISTFFTCSKCSYFHLCCHFIFNRTSDVLISHFLYCYEND